MGNAPAASVKRAVGRCDTVGQEMRSHPGAAHRGEGHGFLGREGRVPPLQGLKAGVGLWPRQAEWYRGSVRLCSDRGGFLFEVAARSPQGTITDHGLHVTWKIITRKGYNHEVRFFCN